MIDLFEEARAVELDERLASGVRGQHSAGDLLQAATADGYASLGWPDGGMIRAGALADLVTVRRDGVRLAGMPPDDAVRRGRVRRRGRRRARRDRRRTRSSCATAPTSISTSRAS